MDTEIILVRYRQDESSGYIAVTVKSRTTDGASSWDGPEMTYGVDAVGFVHRFNSSMEQFEAWVASQHQQYVGANRDLLTKLEARKGMVIGKKPA